MGAVYNVGHPSARGHERGELHVAFHKRLEAREVSMQEVLKLTLVNLHVEPNSAQLSKEDAKRGHGKPSRRKSRQMSDEACSSAKYP